MAVGLRVIRGPQWTHGEEDEGEGHLGTLTSVPSDGLAEVTWDKGGKGVYGAGKQGKYELRIFDSGTVGVRHRGIKCSICGEHDIFGMRWRCLSCDDVTLCPVCYVTDRHVISHEFLRVDSQDSDGVKVKKRAACLRIQSLGIFPGAKIQRGLHWKWGDQDGGQGSVGDVVSLKADGSRKSVRSWVEVRWGEGRVNEYRLGAEGRVDLRCVEEAPGAFYYRDHLPLLDTTARICKPSTPDRCDLKVNDRVTVHIPLDSFKAMHSNYGNWSEGMVKCIGKMGEVRSVHTDQTVTVNFEGSSYRLLRAALRKIPTLRVGDTVQIEADEAKVKLLQENHGEFHEVMKKTLGRVGRVKHVDHEGDVTVEFGGLVLLFHPALCLPKTGAAVDNIEPGDAALKHNPTDVAELLQGMKDMKTEDTAAANGLFKAIMKGDRRNAEKLLQNNPSLVNIVHRNVTPLILASLEGEVDIVTSLLTQGARLEDRDYKGNSALCAALTGQHEGVARMLVERGASVNASNRKKRTPLHLAAYFDLESSLKLLLSRNADRNPQDTDGDTPVHYAVLKERERALVILLADGGVDLTVTNNKQFTPLQFAALNGAVLATEKLLAKDTTLVNSAQPGKFAALHIAAINNNMEIVRLLIDVGGADVNLKGKAEMTALHLAGIEAYPRIVDLLIKKGADINLGDKDDDTPLHLTLATRRNKKREKEEQLKALLGKPVEDDDKQRLTVACLLLDKGANYEALNKRGKTPIEMCGNDQLRQAVKRYVREHPDRICREAPEPKPASVEQQAALEEEEFGSIHIELPCAKCLARPSDVILRPCGHKVVCHRCQEALSKCPLCDRPCEAKERVEQCHVQ